MRRRGQRGSRAWRDALVSGGVAALPAEVMIDDCEVAWTASSGVLRTITTTPTAGGSGYQAGDILDVAGGVGGQVQVSTVDGGGAVTAIAGSAYSGGRGGYSTGSGKATTGGHGSGCTIAVPSLLSPTASASSLSPAEGAKAALVSPGSGMSPRSLLGYHAIAPGNLSGYTALKLWYKSNATVADDDRWLVCLCSDIAGRDVVDSFRLPAVASNTWAEVTIEPEGGGPLDGDYQSIALYTGGTPPGATTQFRLDGIRAVL